MNQRVLAAKQFAKNQAKKVTEYFKPTEKVRARDVVREMPKAIGQVFSGTKDFVNTSGKIMGEGMAYATDSNVRDQYKKGNTNILPTISNPTAGRQLWGNAAKSFGEVATAGKIPGLSKMAMSAKVLPRVLAGGTMGYGYDVADKMSRPDPISQSTFHPGLATIAGALFGGMSRPTSEMLGQAGKEIANDIRTINPANRMTHRVVDKYDMEPVPGMFAPGGVQQQRPIMESFRKEVETTQNPYNPQSSIARMLLGKQPVGMSIKAVDDPILQEARKYKSAEEFVKAKVPVYHGSPVPLKSFSNKKGGVFFTEEYADATGFAGTPDNVYEGFLNFKKPLEIDAKGAKWDALNTKYGKSTQEVISNAQKDGYDGVVFKNIIDNVADDAEFGMPGTVYYAYKPKDAFVNESQLTDLYHQATKK